MAVVSSFVAKHISEGLSTSKAFQDAKEKLGPVYFDAKFVECPQNAVEMAKLLKNLDELEKQRMKTVEKARKNQRILLNTQQSRYNFSKSSRTLLANQTICDNKLPPPGFRYHSNGDPKLTQLRPQGELSHQTQWTSSQNVTEQDGMLPKQKFIALDSNSNHLKIKYSPSPSQEAANIEIEIQKIESIIKELTFYLKRHNLITDSTPSAREKAMSILSAHNRDDVLHRYMGKPRTYKKQNGGSLTLTPKKKSESSTLQERTTSTSHSNCLACQFKVNHTYSNKDFNRSKDNSDKTKYKRWNIAPQGTLIKSPSSRLFVRSSFPFSNSSYKFQPTSTHGMNFKLDKGSKCEARIRKRIKAFVEPQDKDQVYGTRSTQSVPPPRRRSLIPLCYSRSVMDAWKEMTVNARGWGWGCFDSALLQTIPNCKCILLSIYSTFSSIAGGRNPAM